MVDKNLEIRKNELYKVCTKAGSRSGYTHFRINVLSFLLEHLHHRFIGVKHTLDQQFALDVLT